MHIADRPKNIGRHGGLEYRYKYGYHGIILSGETFDHRQLVNNIEDI